MLSLGSARVVDSSQQVIFGGSKTFKRNLNAEMTKKGTFWKPIWGLMLLQSFLSVSAEQAPAPFLGHLPDFLI